MAPPGEKIHRRGRLRTAAAIAASLLLFGLAACEGATPGSEVEAIDRDTFVSVQVDLNLAADAGTDTVTAAERARILMEHGVTDEALRAFIEVHGSDESYMQEVWEEVDREVLEARVAAPADTSG